MSQSGAITATSRRNLLEPSGGHGVIRYLQSRCPGAQCDPGGATRSTSIGSTPVHSRLSSLISFGQGRSWPLSSSDSRLSRKTAQLVLHWCFIPPACLNRTMVQPSFCASSKLTVVPSHCGPSVTCHSTRSVRDPMAMRRAIVVDDRTADPLLHRGLELRAVRRIRREILVAGADVGGGGHIAGTGVGDVADRDVVVEAGGGCGREH